MITSRPVRFVFTVIALAVLYFLSAAQIGLLVGWCFTTSAIIRHTDADLWVMSEQVAAFDYGGPIPRQRIDQVRSIPGVAWAEGMFMAWNTLKREDGHTINIEVVGLDVSNCGAPWELVTGSTDCVHQPDTVIIDELYAPYLGIRSVGDECEMYGQRARVGGISRGVRTFTASPFIFTSMATARKYDKRYREDEVTYVLVRCRSNSDLQVVQNAISRDVPYVECLTRSEFAFRTIVYWMLGTGIGITVVLTAILGFAVGALVTSQTLVGIINDYLPNFATLRAVGFSQSKLVSIVLLQSLILGVLGTLIGSGLFFAAAYASARTPIPLETTPVVFTSLVVVNLVICVGSSLLAVLTVMKVDPVTVFGGQG